jgi:23S rRNA pseudouridine2605 synthase
MTGVRLNRFLARRGISSRRGADLLIVAGRVTVNGVAATVGTAVEAGTDRVEVDHRAVDTVPEPVTLVLNKPAGVVTTVHDERGRPTVMELIRPALGRRRGGDDPAAATPGLVPVGRLDADSRGLLLLSSDGELIHRLTHPRYGVTRRYRVTLDREVAGADLRRLVEGVRLADGRARALSARRSPGFGGSVVDLDMAEGRKREVRRLWAALGLEVIDLVRVAIGPVRLGSLEEGACRRITAAELRALHLLVGLPAPGPRREQSRRRDPARAKGRPAAHHTGREGVHAARRVRTPR